jgi:hypothetical protein
MAVFCGVLKYIAHDRLRTTDETPGHRRHCCDPIRHVPGHGPDGQTHASGLDHGGEQAMQGLESPTSTERIRDMVGAMQGRLCIGERYFIWTENGKPDVEYDGEYANGKRNGHGVMIFPDGKQIEGEWVNDGLLSGDGNAI